MGEIIIISVVGVVGLLAFGPSDCDSCRYLLRCMTHQILNNKHTVDRAHTELIHFPITIAMCFITTLCSA